MNLNLTIEDDDFENQNLRFLIMNLRSLEVIE